MISITKPSAASAEKIFNNNKEKRFGIILGTRMVIYIPPQKRR